MRTEHGEETFHIGRRHVSDDRGDPVVVDWRAPISTAFYRASPAEPMGVELRRRFGVDRGRLTAYEDERLTAGDATEHSGILAAEIERPRSGPMRDIVSTIQPEQDEIVRSDIGTSICVQGAPGTGKTAVGLHRAAWLLYSFRAQLDRSGVLVVGPNRAFLDHIGAVLPSLGEARVGHATIDTLLDARPGPRRRPHRRRHRSRATPGSPRCCTGPSGRTSAAPRSRSWCLGARAAGGCPRTRSRTSSTRSSPEACATPPPATCSPSASRTTCCCSWSAPATPPTTGCSTPWPGRHRSPPTSARSGRRSTRAAVLFRLFSDAAALTAAADGILTAEEQRMLLWDSPPRTKGAARWSRADMALLDEVADLLDRTPSLGHVVLDEAQDLSPMQLRAVGRRASTGSVTVLGDIAQGTTPWATAVVGRRHGPPRPAGARAGRARPRVPRAGPGHRLRRPPAAAHGAGPRGADVGA